MATASLWRECRQRPPTAFSWRSEAQYTVSVRFPFFACHGLAGRPSTDSEQISVQPAPYGSGAYKYFLNALLRSGNSKRAEFFAERMVYNTQDNQEFNWAGQSPIDLVDQFVR